jgi:phosphatidylinositol alpha-1,6-mannosyltransferase
MDILLISWNFPPRKGGIEYLIRNLAVRLQKHHKVFIITSYAHTGESAPAGVFRSPYPGLAAFALYALWRGAWLLAANRRIGVVFGGSVLATPLALALARVFRRRAVVQAHGLDVIYQHPLYRLACVRWMKLCDGVVANSAFTAALARQTGVVRGHIAVIHPGIDAERFACPREAHAIRTRYGLGGKRILLFVGRLTKRKGVEEFVRISLPEIVGRIPDLCFVVVGDVAKHSLTSRGDALGAIKAAAARSAVRGHIRLLGALDDDDLLDLYHACDLLVLPALDAADDVEGFGIVLLEAAAAAKPAVATRAGGIPEAIEDGRTGVLVEPGDYRRLSDAIVDLLRDDSRRHALGLNAQSRALQQFSWEAAAVRYGTLLESVAFGNKAPESA